MAIQWVKNTSPSQSLRFRAFLCDPIGETRVMATCEGQKQNDDMLRKLDVRKPDPGT